MSDNLPLGAAVERTMRLVELLLSAPDGLTPQELLLQLDISRSTLFLLLRSMKALGYVEQAEKRGRYYPGPRLQAWQQSSSPLSRDLLTAFYQEGARLNSPETLALTVRAETGVLVVGQVEGSQQVRSVLQPGQVYPGLCAAAEVLAEFPGAEVQTYGYHFCENEDSLELALPVCPDGATPQAALLLSAPRFRWRSEAFLERHLPEQRALAARLSHQMGAPAYTPFHYHPAAQLQPSGPLSSEEISSFLQGPWTARLACVRPDGRPHVIPVWQEWDGSGFCVVAWQGSQWADYIAQDPNVSLTVDEPWPPLRRVVVRGVAEPLAVGDPATLHKLVRSLANRYLGQLTPGLLEQVQGAFRIQPQAVRGWMGVPGTPARRSAHAPGN